MPGLVPGIHVLISDALEVVDGRVKPGHDGEGRHSPPSSSTQYVRPLSSVAEAMA